MKWSFLLLLLCVCRCCYSDFYGLNSSNVSIGINLSDSFAGNLEAILLNLPWIQNHNWMVCLESNTIFHDQSLIDQVISMHGKLYFEKDHIYKPYCGLKRALKSKSDYLLFSPTSSVMKKSMLILSHLSTNISAEYIFLRGEDLENMKSCSIVSAETMGKCIDNLPTPPASLLAAPNSFLFEIHNYELVRRINWDQVTFHDPTDSFHRSGDIQLWWPLNNTEIFLHKKVPSHLSPLRMKQKFIFSFPAMKEPGTENEDDWLEIRILDLHDSAKTNLATPSFQMIRFSTSHWRGNHNAELVEVTLEFHHYSLPFKQLLLQVFDPLSDSIVGQFFLHLQIVYGTDYWLQSPYTQSSTAPMRLHPMFGQLESRDDLGFALSAFLPHATQMVEIGVNKGQFAQLLLETWDALELYVGVDPWKVWSAERYQDIANTLDQQMQNELFANTIHRLTPYEDKVVLLRETSVNAAKLFLEESVDVVYIDAQHHYQAVFEDLQLWWPKVRSGGLLCGHDYLLDVLDNTIFSVKPAVEKFARDRGLLILQTYDAVQPAYPTWFLFKP